MHTFKTNGVNISTAGPTGEPITFDAGAVQGFTMVSLGSELFPHDIAVNFIAWGSAASVCLTREAARELSAMLLQLAGEPCRAK